MKNDADDGPGKSRSRDIQSEGRFSQRQGEKDGCGIIITGSSEKNGGKESE